MILSINIINIFVLVVLGIILFNVFKIVPQQQAWIIERLGKLHKVLPAGLNFIIPMVDRVAYKHTLKEQAIDVTAQTAISNDNVSLSIDGVL
ncbi:SPFH domain / Band 7 family protein, partial [Orientia tsutsugamushi str. Gilliam]